MLPESLQSLIDALGHLPGVGPRSAERYAYFLFKSSPDLSEKLAVALKNLHSGVSPA